MLADALVLREAIYDVLSPVARNALPKGEALTTLNAALEPLLASSCLTIDGAGARRLWKGAPSALEQVLWPVAWSTVDLVLSDDLSCVRECGNRECHWLFVDRSRDRSRRWCSMAICGNLINVRRFRAK